MKGKEIEKLSDDADAMYAKLVSFAAISNTALIGLVYPEKDGQQDANATASMMLLRQGLYSLEIACRNCIERINAVIDD